MKTFVQVHNKLSINILSINYTFLTYPKASKEKIEFEPLKYRCRK